VHRLCEVYPGICLSTQEKVRKNLSQGKKNLSQVKENLTQGKYTHIQIHDTQYRVFNLKVDRQLSREYFKSDAIYNGSVGMTLHYYMCRSWQHCCRRGENRSWPSVSVESVDSECWCLNNANSYAFIMRLTVEERVFILERYLKTMSLRPL
jgi:hypothetical protein